ncbi:MAG: primosomal replication protein N, partial [Firmicutes bacterium]|nr:primosomal replication protein N [Bacillota bacterium]
MNFNKGKVRDIYLLTTDVENMFINEYMPGAPGDYVKVYLYGLLYAQHEGEMTHEALARHLRLSAETVEEA